MSMGKLISRFLADEHGGTAIEYALIGSGIFLAIVSVMGQVGTQVSGSFDKVQQNLNK
jgi:pilus assembly protein Flp/PilA